MYYLSSGKDDIIFVTKEDFDATEPPVEEEEEPAGLILPSGEINWDCPCLQGMGKGPCGEDFKDAFSCFHYSEAEPKGSDCLEQFKSMQECFVKFPEVYGSLDEDEVDAKQTEVGVGQTKADDQIEAGESNVKEPEDTTKIEKTTEEKV